MVRFSFLVMLSILTLVSCGDDDNPDSSDIQGTWELKSSKTGSNIESDGSDYTTELVYVSGDAEINFKNDGTYEQSGMALYDYTQLIDLDTFLTLPQNIDLAQTGTYTAVNGTLELAVTGNPTSNDGTITTYSIANNQLTLELTGSINTVANGRAVVADVFGTVIYDKL